MVEDRAGPQINKNITIASLIEGVQPRLKGFITSVTLDPKCKHDWEAHRVHSAEVRIVFAKLNAQTITRAAEAARQIREETTTAVCIRKVGAK